MNTVRIVVGLLALIYGGCMWAGHRLYVRKNRPFQMATGYQMLVVTFTGIDLLAGCHAWIVLPAALFYFVLPGLVLGLGNRRYLDPSYLVNYLVLGYAFDWGVAQRTEWWGFLIAVVLSQITYLVLLAKTFPIRERRWE